MHVLLQMRASFLFPPRKIVNLFLYMSNPVIELTILLIKKNTYLGPQGNRLWRRAFNEILNKNVF